MIKCKDDGGLFYLPVVSPAAPVFFQSVNGQLWVKGGLGVGSKRSPADAARGHVLQRLLCMLGGAAAAAGYIEYHEQQCSQ